MAHREGGVTAVPWNPACPECGTPVDVDHPRSRIIHNDDGTHTVRPTANTDPKTTPQ